MKIFKKLLKQGLVRPVSVADAYPVRKSLKFLSAETFQTPEVVQMPLSQVSQAYAHTEVKSCDVNTHILEDVLYCPEYRILLTNKNRPILESYNVIRSREDFNLKYIFNKDVEEISGLCTVLHHFDNNYYHALLENLPRFYSTCQHPLIKDEKKEVKLILSRHVSSQFFLNSFMPDNVIPHPVKEGKLYRLERVIVSDFPVRQGTGCLPSFYRQKIYDPLLPKRSREKRHRIYISREKAYNCRHIVNEDEMLAVLDRHGFKKYLLETLSPQEQIDLFYDAEIVLSPHGAGLTNMIFGSKLKVIELFSGSVAFPHYYYLSKACGHEYTYAFGQPSQTKTPFQKDIIAYSKNMNFTIDVDQIKRLFE